MTCALEPSPSVAQDASQREPQLWAADYVHARELFISGSWAQAARELDALAASAPTPAQQLLASELMSIARAKLGDGREHQPALRTSDELTLLYTTAVLYGLGASAWLSIQVEPKNVAGALLPFATLTPAAVSVVALADHYRPLRHGIPHAIAAGLYLGLGEGLWLTGFQSAYAGRHADVDHWGAQRVSTALWLTSTAGGLAGALIGAVNRPTPGRVSFTASTAIWGGALAAFASHAFDPSAQHTYLTGALAYNAGLLAGIVFGPVIAPSVKRVRYCDLGGMFGALLAGGSYALIARHVDSRMALGLAAMGGSAGLGVTIWATRDMPPDRSHDALAPFLGQRPTRQSRLQPAIMPTPGGFLAGLSGEL